MKSIVISRLSEHIGETVRVNGWVWHRRSSGKISFFTLRDGTGLVQSVLVHNEVGNKYVELFKKLSLESSVTVEAEAVSDKRAPGGVELKLKSFEIIGDSKDYPISLKEHNVGFLLDNRHLWIRSVKQANILTLRHWVICYLREFFVRNGYILTDTPILTPTICEGTTTLFKCDYFDRKAYLAQSGQLYLEASASALSKVFNLGPTFRAEKSKTKKHLTEFWMLEIEQAFLQNIDELIDIAEDMILYVIKKITTNHKELLEKLRRDIKELLSIKKPFSRVSYKDAVDIISKKESTFKYGEDITGTGEVILAEHFNNLPVFVHNFPKNIKAFYMKEDENEPETVLGIDLIGPKGFGELIGGSLREDNLTKLKENMKIHKLPEEVFKWYLDIRRYGSVPHGGFGLGIERLVTWIGGIEHVRETILFPRTIYRLEP